MSRVRVLGFAALLLAVLAFPAAFGRYPVKLLQEILIWGIYAMSLDLLMGHAGMVSFGHSAFFGIGGYAAALALTGPGGAVGGPLGALLLPAAAGALAALVIGFFSIRVSGVYFIMLTLAFSQMFYAVAFQNAFLGAEDGLVGIPRPAVLGMSIGSTGAFHGYLLVIVFACALFLWRVVRSPFGHVLRGIHENEARMQAVGYPVNRYKLTAFVIAGAVGGLAGALLTNQTEYLTPSYMHWTRSGDIMVMVILGGMGTLYGPVLGAVAFLLLEDILSAWTVHWQVVLGPMLVLVVLYARRGLYGLLPGGAPRDA